MISFATFFAIGDVSSEAEANFIKTGGRVVSTSKFSLHYVIKYTDFVF